MAKVPMAAVVIDQSVLLEEKARKQLTSDKVLLEKLLKQRPKTTGNERKNINRRMATCQGRIENNKKCFADPQDIVPDGSTNKPTTS